MKMQQSILFLILVLISGLFSSAHAEIRALNNEELKASSYTYKGRITQIQWIKTPSTGCVSLVKNATLTLALLQSDNKTAAKLVRVTGFVNTLNGCPGATGNWELENLKVGDTVLIYGEKFAGEPLVSIRRPNGLSVITRSR